jgi:hypothetical protein
VGFASPTDYYRNAVNNASITGHHHIKGYDPLEIEAYAKFEAAASHNPTHPVYQMMGIRYIFSFEDRYDPGYELIGLSNDTIYYENNDPFPRAWVTYEGVLQPNDAAALDALFDDDFDFRKTVILSEPLDCELGDETSTAEITTYTPNAVNIRVSGTGGVLVLSDQYYPGWRATVDGERVDIKRAYTTLRAICVPAGEHTVSFVYRPLSVIWGAVISGVGWLLLCVMAVVLMHNDHRALTHMG